MQAQIHACGSTFCNVRSAVFNSMVMFLFLLCGMVLFVSSLLALFYEYGSLCSSSPYLYYILIFLIDPVVFNLNVFEFMHLVRYMS